MKKSEIKNNKNHKMKIKKSGIKKRLIITLLPSVALVLMVIVVMSYMVSKSLVMNAAKRQLKAESASIVNDIQTWLVRNLSSLRTVHGTLESMDMQDKEIMRYLEYTAGLSENMPTGVYIGKEDGTYLDATWTPPADYVPAERDWYQAGLEHEDITLGMPYLDAETGELIVSASAILDTGNAGEAVISADLFLNTISDEVARYKPLDTGYSFLVDKTNGKNTVLAHADKELLAKNLGELDSTSLESQAGEFLSSEAGKVESIEAGGENYLLTSYPVGESQWVLFSCVKESDILKDVIKLQILFWSVLAAALVLIGILVERLSHMVVKPIRRLTGNIEQMTAGDFGTEVVAKGRDEVGFMSRSLQDFIMTMRTIITDINQISGRMNDQAEKSREVSVTLYESAENQTESMHQLHLTVEEMAHSVEEVANNATALADIVSQTGQKGNAVSGKMQETVTVSLQGKNDMGQIRTAMGEIRESIQTLEHVVNDVGNSTEEIEKFVGIIGGIATQTNLLSLNASIEAARAGEAGKGFAVVAGEIGKLAETSAQAVSEISNLTRNINGLVDETTRQTRQSVESMEKSGALVSQAGETFDTIFETIQETGRIVEEMVKEVQNVDEVATSVAAITEQQSASTEQILATADSLSQLSADVTENSQSVAKDAEKLSESAELLAEHMKGFQV